MYKKQKLVNEGIKIVETLRADEPNNVDVDIDLENEIFELKDGIEDMSPEELAKYDADLINHAIEAIPSSIKEAYIGSEYFNEVLKKLHSSNWNKLSPKERKSLFLEVHGYTHYVFGKEVISNQIMFSETMIEDDYVYIEEGNTYIYDKLFDSKNSGISILSNYVYALTKDLIISIGDNMYNLGIDSSLLSPLAREYYENMQSSYLHGSWSNLRRKGDKYYYSQPIIHDSLNLSKEIMIEHVKWLYKEYEYIDQELSSLINQHMNEINNQKLLSKKRREAVTLAKSNIKKSIHEVALYDKYLEQSASVFSKLTDDEFYELFNVAYISALNSNEDGKLAIRMSNMVNELLKRTFKDFDLTGIELPKYKVTIDEENATVHLGRVYEGVASINVCPGSGQALSVVLNDIVMLSQKHALFKFNNEKEKEDYYMMKKWVDLKNHDYSDSVDNEIVKDGLNIILRKTNELLSDINEKIKKAISKSKFVPHGKSMITHDNKEALYDYHEFKNLYTKDEVTEGLMEYIRLDVEEMNKNKDVKKNGGRK